MERKVYYLWIWLIYISISWSIYIFTLLKIKNQHCSGFKLLPECQTNQHGF